MKAALQAGQPPTRRDVERALRETFGLSARLAKRFAAQGAKALNAGDDGADMVEIIERLKALEEKVRS